MWTVRSWKLGLLLSIIIPVGLLMAFRLTGILREPLTISSEISETITLDPVHWHFERPCGYLNLNESVEARYTDEVSTYQKINIGGFTYKDSYYGGSDSLFLTPNITAQVEKGFITDLHVGFNDSYERSQIDFHEIEYKVKLSNLALTNYSDVDWFHPYPRSDFFINLAGVNFPKNISFYTPVDWALYSPYNQTHQLEITSEITYYNDSVLKKIIQPFMLEIGPDNNDNFETARIIQPGMSDKLWIGQDDRSDWYKIQLIQGQKVHIDVNNTHYFPILAALMSVHIYDPQEKVVTQSDASGFFETVDFVANATGYWYIEVRIVGGGGMYLLAVSVPQ